MHYSLLTLALISLGQTQPLGSGDHQRTLTVDELKRVHWIHVPSRYDSKVPTAIVLVLHGAMMDGKIMESFCGLNKTADQNQFITVYPNGTGPGGLFQTWNAGIFPGELNKNRADDVKYLDRVLDDVTSILNVNPKRIYVAGLSNGAMMAYRLAAERSERIAAIASVAGSMVIEKYEPKRPVPVVHFHGTKDTFVPYNGPDKKKNTPFYLRFRSVEDTILECVKANGCVREAREYELDTKFDQYKVIRKEYPSCKHKADVVLYVVQGGGHTWPGMLFAPAFLGPSTRNISANEIMWDFFKEHSLE